MPNEGFRYRIINDKKKQVEITYKNKTIRLQLKKKRSFTVLKKIHGNGKPARKCDETKDKRSVARR